MKLKGDVHRNPWGDLTLDLSDQEKKLVADSVDESARRPGLNEGEREHFLDTWGNELETMGSEATIAALGSLPLPRMRGFLRATDIPEHCLAAILSFSVDDFEDVEDLELISTEIIECDRIRIEYFFQLQTLVWTVEVSEDDYHGTATILGSTSRK